MLVYYRFNDWLFLVIKMQTFICSKCEFNCNVTHNERESGMKLSRYGIKVCIKYPLTNPYNFCWNEICNECGGIYDKLPHKCTNKIINGD
jgi:hypothetical protein